MADSFVPSNNFGIVSSDTVLSEELSDFFGEDIQAIPRKKAVEADEEDDKPEEKGDKKAEGKKKATIEVVEKPKVLDENDLLDGFGESDDEEDTDDQETEDADEKQGEQKSGSIFSDIAEEMYDQGIFTEEEGDERDPIITPEQFRDRMLLESRKQVGQVLQKFLNEKGEEANDIFNAILVDGVEPRTYLEKFADIKDAKALDLSSESNQEKVLREFYKRMNMKNIDARIEKHKTYGDLEQEALDARDTLVAQDEEALVAQREAAKQKELTRTQIRQDYLNNVSRILGDKLSKKDFDGIPVTKQFADEIGGYITNEVYQTPDGKKLTTFDKELFDLNKPENYELKVKMAMLLKIVKQDPTLSRLKKAAVSTESSKLFDKIAQRVTKGSSKESQKKDAQSNRWFTN